MDSGLDQAISVAPSYNDLSNQNQISDTSCHSRLFKFVLLNAITAYSTTVPYNKFSFMMFCILTILQKVIPQTFNIKIF